MRPSVEEADQALVRANLAGQGHKITLVTEYIDMDDSSGHAKCSCGWKSRSIRNCWTRDEADKHLQEVRK